MDKLPVGQLPDLQQSNNDDEIMVITNSEYNQLKKEKISDLITDFTSTNENNALTKGTDGKLFVTDFGNASNITEGKLPVSVLPDIPKDLLPEIETADLPASGVVANTYTYPSSVTVNAQGQVTAISEGSPSGANANTDLSNITEAGKEVIRENSGTGFNMFDLVVKDHVLSFEESKGFGLQGTYVYKDAVSGSRYGYPDFYNKCIAEKAAGTETQTQLGETTITTYNNSNGHIFYDIADKSTVDTYFESTGEAWFYGIDTANERIFLPRNKYFAVTKDVSVIGNGKALGITNGTLSCSMGNASSGGFALEPTNSEPGAAIGTAVTNNSAAWGNTAVGIVEDSENSGLVGELTPDTTKYLYIVVGNTAEVQSTTVELTTDSAIAPIGFDSSTGAVKLNYADGLSLDSGGNLTSLTNIQAAHAAMPSTQYVDLTPVSGQQYTAVADGYFVLSIYSNNIAQAGLVNRSLSPNPMQTTIITSTRSQGVSCYLPAAKGQNIEVYFAFSTTTTLIFVYAQGASND